MKLTALLLVIFVLQTSLAASPQTITFSGKGVRLEKVFAEVKSQTGYLVMYNYNVIRNAKPVTISVENEPLQSFMHKVLDKQQLDFSILNKTIVIKRKTETPVHAPSPAPPQPEQPPVDIEGKITDEAGAPLVGATIRVKGSEQFTTSDAEGKFSLKNVKEGAVLEVSYIGYVTREVAVNGNSAPVITLQKEVSQLSDVVVVGYGFQKRRDVTSAIASFKPTEENARPALSPDQLIQGRMPGVQVSAGSGSPGSTNRVSIRGIGSLSATNEPLYVIDGIPVVQQNAALINMGENMNPLALLNPNDIESVEVLKDAASAAIYGSRATNGVIIITTKSGRAGKAKFTVDYTTGMQQVPNLHKIKMAGSDLYLEVINEAIDNYNVQNNLKPGNSGYMLRKENPYPGLPDTDWMDVVLRTGRTQSVGFSITSGTDKTKLYISGNYLNQEGAIKTQEFERYTGKLNISHKLNNWLEFGANTNFSFSHNDRIPGSNLGSTIMARAIPQRPFDRPYKPNGEYYVGGTEDLIYHNPLQILNEENTFLNTWRLLGNFYGSVNLAKGLVFKSAFGADLTYTLDNVHYNEKHPYGTGVGSKTDARRFSSNVLWENTLNYNKTFGKLDFGALAGYSYQKLALSNISIEGRGFPSPAFDVLSVASEITAASTGLSESALLSLFGRTNFSWDGKYLLTLSLRTDGSSKFSPNNRWGYFPAVSAGWNISDENFWIWEPVQAKLRASYGATGNQDGISSYAYLAQMSGGRNYGLQSGIAVSTNGNEDLTWETARQLDVGLDLALLRGKLNFTVDYFIKKTDNLLYSRPQPATSGFTSIISNIGSMQNKGLELLVGTNLNFGKLQWSSDFNIAFIKNKLTSLIGDDALLIGANRTLKVGEEVGSHYLYKQLGIYQDDKDVPASFYANGVRAGDVIYEDIDNNGIIDVNDRQIVGSSNPDFFGGWNNSFRYKNFDLNFFFTYSYGVDVYASYRLTIERLGNNFVNNTERAIKERWTGPGTSNTTPRAIYGSTWNTQNSTRYLEDGSYIRLRSLNLGYTVPAKLLSRFNMSRVRVYAQADNLFLLTKYSGMDPEVTSDFDPQFLGQDNLILPQLRVINFGINISF
jgi:TonB-linked outer membrane protein, SusC/RagA family